MAKKRKRRQRGLRIGGFRIQPLGLILLILILLIIAACVIWFGGKPTEVGGDGFLSPTATPTPTPVPTPTPTPSPTPTPAPRSATIRSLGEIAIQDNLLAAAKGEDGNYDFSPMFEMISDLMGNADYTIADVEGSLGGTGDFSGGNKLRTPPSLIQTLADCGVDMLNLSNDHALDGDWADLAASMQNCQAAGMAYVGAAASQEERNTPKIIDVNGIHIGFVGYTEGLNGQEATASAEARQFGINLAAASNPNADIKALRDAGAEIVIACVSWGEMFNRAPTQTQQNMAQVLVQSGADVIIGYNPHVIQKALWVKMENSDRQALCILSNGNFLSDSRQRYSDSGVIFQFTIREDSYQSGLKITDVQYIPTYVWRIENEDGSFDYRTIPCGPYLESAPEGMSYSQESRMREVWAEAQSIMGSKVATVAKE